MTDQELLALLADRESKCDESGQRSDDISKGIEYYEGRPFGNEVEGRSQIVVRELFSTVEWIMPALMRMFFGTDAPVLFAPRTKDDADAAEQETDYVNYIVADKNEGFEIFMSWFKDALLSRNSYVVADWDEREDVTETVYEGLTLEQATMMLLDGDMELLESEVETILISGQEVDAYTIRVKQTQREAYAKITNIPSERVSIQANLSTVSLKNANYVSYWETKTISELRELGFDVPDDIADDDEVYTKNQSQVETSRNLIDPHPIKDDYDSDPASREVDVRTSFVRCDYDRDGIAELRKVIHLGKRVLYNELAPMITMACLTPMVMPHRHQGVSFYDALKDIQEIQSTLMRGLLDNTYLANNGRFAVNEDTVDLDDLLESRPGSAVRTTGNPNEAIMPLVHPSLSGNVVQVLEYISLMSENRTGASPRAMQGQAVDGNAINQTASGMSQIMNAALSRIELIARVFAETGVKDLFNAVHCLTLTHQNQAEMFEVRNEWVEVDPREWKRRYNMRVQVGLGTGSKDAQIAKLQMLLSALPNLMAMNITTPHHIYTAFAKLIDLMGWKNVGEFLQDPADPNTPPAPQAPPDPKVLVEQAKIANDRENKRIDATLKAQQIDADIYKAELNARTSAQGSWINAQTDLAKFIVTSDQGDMANGATLVADESELPKEATARVLAMLQDMAKPKRRRYVHHRDANGSIVGTEEITEE